MIQDFCLETDNRGNRLYLKPTPGTFFEDGSEYCWDAETIWIDGKYHITVPSATFHGAGQRKSLDWCPTAEEAAELCCEYNKSRRTKPKYKFVAAIGGLYSGEDKPSDAKMYPGYESVIEAAVERMLAIPYSQFEQECHDEMADDFDGSVGMGYRFTDSQSYTDEMYISLCHYFYGK